MGEDDLATMSIGLFVVDLSVDGVDGPAICLCTAGENDVGCTVSCC